MQVCTTYKDGAPVYETLPGWGDLQGLGAREALPQQVLDYLSCIERFTGVPVTMFSTSPKREDTFGAVSWSLATPAYQRRRGLRVERCAAAAAAALDF